MRTKIINNEFYNELGDAWYLAKSHPIAILRAEQKAKNPWVIERINSAFDGRRNLRVLDVGCGAGFLSNAMGEVYEEVIGLDASESSLEVARRHAGKAQVKYIHGDAYQLPFEEHSLDVVCAMDFLEHVEKPSRVVEEAARVLRPGGLFFFHTFNRNFLSWLVVIKFMEWFVPNTPENVHCLKYFIKPRELDFAMEAVGLLAQEWRGLRPCFDTAFFKSLIAREVRDDFCFKLSEGLALGYLGYARKY